jgi:hypothetical protein
MFPFLQLDARVAAQGGESQFVSNVLASTDGDIREAILCIERMRGGGNGAEAALDSLPRDYFLKLTSDAAMAVAMYAIGEWDVSELGQRRLPLVALVHAGQVPPSLRLAVLSRLAGTDAGSDAPGEAQSFVHLVGSAGSVPSDVKDKIRRDLPRTGWYSGAFDPDPETGPLYRLLVAYAAFDPALGYVQGMNYVAALCIFVAHDATAAKTNRESAHRLSLAAAPYPDDKQSVGSNKVDEVAAFRLFVKLMLSTELRRVYDSDDDHLDSLALRLKWHVKFILPKLSDHLERLNLPLIEGVDWITTLFASTLEPRAAVAVLGCYLVEGGLSFLVQLGLALLAYLEADLLGCDAKTLSDVLKARLQGFSAADVLRALALLPNVAKFNCPQDHTMPSTASAKGRGSVSAAEMNTGGNGMVNLSAQSGVSGDGGGGGGGGGEDHLVLARKQEKPPKDTVMVKVDRPLKAHEAFHFTVRDGRSGTVRPIKGVGGWSALAMSFRRMPTLT